MIHKWQLRLSLAAILISVPTLSSASHHRSYREDSPVALVGVLEIQAFPGPPDYESIAQGDEIEHGLFIQLNQPIVVSSSEGLSKVKVLQLAGDVTEKHFQEGRERKKVHAFGRLFLRFNGHHHSRVLLEVSSIEAEAESPQ